MKKYIFSIFIMTIMVIFAGCSQIERNSTNSLNVTKDDEKTILEYLDAKTNDILAPREGKVCSAFDILGTDNDKIYTWVLKREYIKHNNEMIQGSAVSLPVVLNIKMIEGRIKVTEHKFPRDGNENAEDLKKLFPKNVRDLMYNEKHNERVTNLENYISNRMKREI